MRGTQIKLTKMLVLTPMLYKHDDTGKILSYLEIIFRCLKKHILERWTRLVKEKDVISGREALKRRLEAKVLCAVPDYVPFSMREH